MSTLEFILLFSFLGSIGSLIGGVLLLSKKSLALKISHFLASFAAGTLLGTAFFDLLPESLGEAQKLNINVPLWILIGILIFFLIERFFHFFHHHQKQHESDKEVKSTVPLIVIGDTVHNFVDGIVIAATFLSSIPLGIITTLAVIAHEIPQEIGDIGLLLHKGLTRKQVITVNVLSASVSIIASIMTYIIGGILENYIPIFLALTTGFFIYISTTDLIPEIQYEKNKKYALIKTILLFAGILLIYTTVSFTQHK